MKITIVAAGRLKERYLRDGVAEYEKRLSPFARIRTVEISEEKLRENHSAKDKEKALIREGECLLKNVPEGSFLFALDVHGRAFSSGELASYIRSLTDGGRELSFLIGGPFGISDGVRERADELLSLSPMTFTHQMTRLILIEQIYRAFKINRGEKYHW